jgi:hypothetical protein
VNVDSAKKKAVMYHMDYDGFRQMVLGANLYNIKRGEAAKLFEGAGGVKIGNAAINQVATINEI